MKKINFIILMFVLLGCNQTNDDRKYFNGEIFLVEDNVQLEKLTGKEVDIKGNYRRDFFPYDSLLIIYYYDTAAPNFFDVYSLKTDSILGSFCFKGKGPNEVSGISPVYHFYKDKDNLKTLLYEPNQQNLIEWNITESLKQHTTINDTIIPYHWMVDNHATIFNQLFRLNENTVFVITPPFSATLDSDTASLPVYEKRTIYTNKQIQSYSVFLDSPKSADCKLFNPWRIFSSYYSIKPDLSKIAQSLTHLCQINIIDIESGIVKGFRLKGTSDFSVFEKNIADLKYNYTNLVSNNEFIYVLFKGIEFNKRNTEAPSIVYVYDWDGNLVRKFDLGRHVSRIRLDEVNNLVYAQNDLTDKIYCYDFN